MNLNKTGFLSGVAIMAVAVSSAPAADPNAGPRMSGDSRAAITPRFASPQSAPRQPAMLRSGNPGQQSAGRSGNWRGRHADWHGRHRDWHNQNPRTDNAEWRRGHRDWHNRFGSHGRWHRRYYPRYYYSSFYPYGYPGGWYGYPYYGASAHLYYHGTAYRQYQYEGQGAGNLAVAVQQELRRAGYYRGPIDGVIGSGTRRAIRAYERAHGLPADGRIDDELLGQMGLS